MWVSSDNVERCIFRYCLMLFMLQNLFLMAGAWPEKPAAGTIGHLVDGGPSSIWGSRMRRAARLHSDGLFTGHLPSSASSHNDLGHHHHPLRPHHHYPSNHHHHFDDHHHHHDDHYHSGDYLLRDPSPHLIRHYDHLTSDSLHPASTVLHIDIPLRGHLPL